MEILKKKKSSCYKVRKNSSRRNHNAIKVSLKDLGTGQRFEYTLLSTKVDSENKISIMGLYGTASIWFL